MTTKWRVLFQIGTTHGLLFVEAATPELAKIQAKIVLAGRNPWIRKIIEEKTSLWGLR